MAELVPRPIFVTGDKRPVVVFHTSSRAKYSQALAMFDIAGLQLAHRAQDSAAYTESYAGSKQELLTEAVSQIRRRGGSSAAYFFVEDTSIAITALSPHDGEGFPGLMAKEWFAETSFEDLSKQLDQAGDRSCVVRSGIALSVPGLGRPEFFHGETPGQVLRSRPQLPPSNVFYPWLSADSFSSWFVPTGATRTLSEMSFEESLKYDFRAQALALLLDRLEEYSIAMNLGPSSFSRRQTTTSDQLPLFSVSAPLLLVVGPTCAGKTTFGIQLQQIHGWKFVDASSVVRVMRDERGVSDQPIAEFANSLLASEGADVVARYIARDLVRDETAPIVITGFRTIEEVEFFRNAYPDLRMVSLSAPQRLRYERFIHRNSRDLRTYSDFQRIDEDQHRLGLLRVADDLADVLVENVYTETEYVAQIAKVVDPGGIEAKGVTKVERRLQRDTSQLYRCLTILRNAGRPLTTQEVSARFEDRSIRHNNANKMLKRYPELAQRQESPGDNVRYHITPTGLAFLSAIDGLATRVSQTRGLRDIYAPDS